MKKYFTRSCCVLLFFLGMLSLKSCKITRFVVYNFADIKDYKIFPKREIETDSLQFRFPEATSPKAPKEVKLSENDSTSFENFLSKNKTVAFLIIHNDSIQYEHYFHKYDAASIVPSFSMAKSIVSILTGIAIDEGKIKSVEEPVTNYVPELKGKGFDKEKIKNLLQMTSGIKFNESYVNPFGDAATYYYGRNLRKQLYKMKLEEDPGTEFKYISGATQLLGLVLKRALKDETLSDYLEEKLWQPLGMEFDASWSLDKKKNGIEKAFCCINARARDFAKIGRLYLHQGNWNGHQIVSESWVNTSTKVDTTEGAAWNYQYQWWLPTKEGDFMADGLLGQYIYVNPDKNLVIVRLGKKEGDVNWPQLFVNLAQRY